MIYGNGDLATALREAGLDNENITFFASGVSNSQETNEDAYGREILMLRDAGITNHLVYFSSLSIYYGNSRYVSHKIYMEKFIKMNFQNYTIVRIGNIMWGNNPNTIINFFKNKNRDGEIPTLQEGYRYLLNKEEFIYWMKMIPVGVKNEMNITGTRHRIYDIWQMVINKWI